MAMGYRVQKGPWAKEPSATEELYMPLKEFNHCTPQSINTVAPSQSGAGAFRA